MDTYKFKQNNYFLQPIDLKQDTNILNNIPHYLLNNLSYYQCIIYLVFGYISNNCNDKYVPNDIQNVCIYYLGNPFLFYIGEYAIKTKSNLNTIILIFEAFLQLDIQNNCYNSKLWQYLGKTHYYNGNDLYAISALELSEIQQPNCDSISTLIVLYYNQQKSEKCFPLFKSWLKHYTADCNTNHTNNANFAINCGHDWTFVYKSTWSHRDLERQILLNKALLMDENNVDLLSIIGFWYQLQNKSDVAITYFTKISIINENDEINLNRLGASLANKGEENKALNCYSKALKINPNYVAAWINVGIAKLMQNEYLDAIDSFLKAFELNEFIDDQQDIWNRIYDSAVLVATKLNKNDLKKQLISAVQTRNMRLMRQYLNFLQKN